MLHTIPNRSHAPLRPGRGIFLLFAFLTAFLCVHVFASPALAVTASDTKLTKAVFKAIDRNRFKDALKLTRRIKDPDLVRVLVWTYLTAPNTPAKFEDVQAFLKQHTDWPNREQMLKRAEETMPHSFSAAEVMAWFDRYGGPVSTLGEWRKAEAQIQLGQKKVGQEALRQLWIDGNFTKSQEKNYYRKYKQLLSAKDHLARLDRLIWQERYWPARRQLWKVDNKHRKLAVARIWLMRREGNVDTAITNVKKVAPELINDPGLVYERMRWRRRKGRTDGAAELLDLSNGDPTRPDKWWRERAIITRSFLQEDKPQKAYNVSSRHGLSPEDAAEYSDAEWISGWIALQFLKSPDRAYRHFQNMLKAVSYPISLARGSYWSARAAAALGQNESARRLLSQAAKHTTTYYGQLAQARLGLNAANFPAPPVPSNRDTQAFRAHTMVKAAAKLSQIGLEDRLRAILLGLADVQDTPGWKRLAAEFAAKHGRPDLAVSIAKQSERAGMPLGLIGYPHIDPPKPKTGDEVETPLVLAVIRQESAFYTTAQSHAGARGLMQVMPATAKRVARANRLPYSRDKLLKDPNYNMVIGQVYLADMVQTYEGSYPMALAAYNAGPHRVQRWVKTFGDPREGTIDTIDWVELIPYSETRNYVQRVLENLVVYRTHLPSERVAQNNGDTPHEAIR